jgi:hypothetical protein
MQNGVCKAAQDAQFCVPERASSHWESIFVVTWELASELVAATMRWATSGYRRTGEAMKIWCVDRESEESVTFELAGEKPPRMLAIPDTVNGHQCLREFELLNGEPDGAVYLETEASAERVRLAA